MSFTRTPSKNRWAHRRLLISPHFADPQLGADVEALQRAVNREAARLGHIGHLKVDGACGRHTVALARMVAKRLGIGLRGPGVSVYVQHLIRHPTLRTPVQKRRGKRYRAAHRDVKVKVTGNHVEGGKTARERLVAAAMQAAALFYNGQSHRFYSQPGAWTVDHGITGETPGRDRSDCSQFATAMHHSADAPDPNGANWTGGWTGSLEAHCTEITRGQLKPGDLVIYGPRGATHHVEVYVGPGDRTVGHGSPPVDYGDIHMIAGARYFRCPGLD